MSRSTLVMCGVVLVGTLPLVLSSPALGADAPLRATGVASLDGAGGAWTYSDAFLPAGATLAVHVGYPSAGTTVVTLKVKGALANREYGAHAHKAACTAVGTDAGGHFQFVPNPDPLNPTDPTYANPANEVWLDLHTNAAGNGSAKATVPWQPADARPMSVVIHESHTATEPGTAGTAGARLGCLTVPF